MAEKIRKETDIDFEIHFCEGLLAHRPDFVPALTVLGDLYTKKGLYAQGLEIDKRLCQMVSDDPIVFYNLACSYSLMNQLDQAFSAMKLAIDNGYNDFRYMGEDQDLENLWKDSRFTDYLTRLKTNRHVSTEKQT